MITDTEIRIKGIETLIAELGELNAERFISLILREPFDYTKWQRNLWNDKSIEEISTMAMKNRKQDRSSSIPINPDTPLYEDMKEIAERKAKGDIELFSHNRVSND